MIQHNRVCTDSASEIKGPMSDCGENNSLLSLFVLGSTNTKLYSSESENQQHGFDFYRFTSLPQIQIICVHR